MAKSKILMHVCCAPCLIFPLKELMEEDFEVKGFFYNPNIYPQEEYNRRKKTLAEYSKKIDFNVDFPQGYDFDKYLDSTAQNKEKPERCQNCWSLRLKKTAQRAKELNFDGFTTTLLVSPYQDNLLIKEIGEKIASERGMKFYFRDFQQGYKESVRISKEENLYRQKYCGCSFSQNSKD